MKLTEAEFKQLFQKNITPRKKRKKEEDILQERCEGYLIKKGIQSIHLKTFIARRCSCRKWNNYAIEGNKGVCDLVILTEPNPIFVELKSKEGYLSPHQKKFRDSLPDTYKFYLIRTFEDFVKLF